ncbi:MAG TPA: hypothetical protein GX406_06300 [Pseudoclavibacter sp.]|nr:hypothetical protein [Pseudoclavibacter sp.]
MSYLAIALCALAAVVLVAAAAGLSWRRAVRAQERSFPAPHQLDTAAFPTGAAIPVSYVATTVGSDPFARVAAHGLAFRGAAELWLGPAGVGVQRRGERSFLIPPAQLRGVQTAQTAIDRAVERDGLVAVAWQLGDTPVVTTLRPQQASERNRILASMRELFPRLAQ